MLLDKLLLDKVVAPSPQKQRVVWQAELSFRTLVKQTRTRENAYAKAVFVRSYVITLP